MAHPADFHVTSLSIGVSTPLVFRSLALTAGHPPQVKGSASPYHPLVQVAKGRPA